MASGTSAKWEKFFLDAGVPTTVAAEYAVIFSDNRMRIDMLNELNKDILGDLGIKVMGDVLNILRHSKKVYAQYERVKAEDYERRKNSEPLTKQASVAKKEIPTLKSLPKASNAKPSIAKPSVAKPSVAKPSNVKPSSKSTGRKTLSERFGQIESDVVPPTKKFKNSESTFTVNLGKTTKLKMSKVVPQQPKVNVVPAQGKTVTFNVFDRLGKPQTNKEVSPASKIIMASLKPLKSSLTQKPDSKPESGIFNRLGSPSSPPPLAGSQGIFRRLGDRIGPSTANTTTTSTTTTNTTNVGNGRPLPFSNFTVTKSDHTKSDSIRLGLSNSHSVLRPVKPVKPVIRTGTLAMDMEPYRATKTTVPQPKPKPKIVSKPKQGKSVFDRLGN